MQQRQQPGTTRYISWLVSLALLVIGGCIIDDLDTGGLRCGPDGGCSQGRSCFAIPDYGPHCLSESNGYEAYTASASLPEPTPDPIATPPEAVACPSSCETNEDCAACPGRTTCSNFIAFKACSVEPSSCPTTCETAKDCNNCPADRTYCIDLGAGIKACAAGDSCNATCTKDEDCKDCAASGRPYCKPPYQGLKSICLP